MSNQMTAEKIAGLKPGDIVIIAESPSGWGEPLVNRGTVVRLTPTQVVVDRGRYEDRFRRQDARRVGDRRAELIDPEHPASLRAAHRTAQSRRAKVIDRLAYQWGRDRADLGLLRELRCAIDNYLAAEDTET